MTDDTHEINKSSNNNERWWAVSLSSLAVFTLLGFIFASFLPFRESDWFGIRFIVVQGVGFLVGAIFCVGFAAVSAIKGEKRSLWAIAAALPCFIILIMCISIRSNDKKEKIQYEKTVEDLKSYKERVRVDPEVVLRQHWDLSMDAMKYVAFTESFSDEKVNYTPEMLQTIYDKAPKMRDYLFQHRTCSKEFISAHFKEAYERCDKISYVMLASMMKNPNTPIELIEQVARAKKLPAGAVHPAIYALEKRKPNQPLEPSR